MGQTTETTTNLWKSVLIGRDSTNVREHDKYGYDSGKYHSYGNYGTVDNIPEVIPTGKYFYSCPYLSFGDYDNSCQVERSNVRLFLEMYKDYINKDFYHLTGMYGSESIYIDITTTNEEIIDTLNGLLSYPAISDEDCSMVEIEIENECLNSYVLSDLTKKIGEKFGISCASCEDNEKLEQLYCDLKDKTNTYFVVESGGNGYVDIDRLIDGLDSLPEFITE